MIQLNLLPDVKLEYIKSQKMRSLVMSISIIVSAVAIVILLLFVLFDFAQKHKISDLKSDISNETSTIKAKPNINTILTVQNQLESLTDLYASRPAAANLFTSYLNEVTPETVSLNALTVDFVGNTFNLTGTTNSLKTVNQYIDTLKLTTYSVKGSKTSSPAFTNVVLSTFGLNSQATDPSDAATFNITLDFAPSIFKIADDATLTVPNITITHYDQQDSGSLFKTTSTTSNSTGGQ